MDKEILKIISYLNILELPNDNLITSDQVNEAYRKLSHIYHPDVANARYKDGKKFVELKDAHDYLINNIDYVNNLIKNSFSLSAGQSRYSTSDAAYEKWKQEQEFQRRRQEEENRRRQEEERIRKQQEEARRREEARKREEERKRQEELRKEKERQEKIKQKKLYDARKVSILVDVQQFLGSFNKDDYYDAEYKQINDLVGSFIHNVNSDAYSAASEIDNGFLELKEAVGKVKTKEQILKTKQLIRWFIAGASFVVVLIIMITLTVNVFVPSAKYNKAVKQMNEGNYAEAIATFQNLGSFKDSESKVYEAQSALNLKKQLQYEQQQFNAFEASDDLISTIEAYKKIGGTVNFEYELNYGETIDDSLINEYGYANKVDRNGYSFYNWEFVEFKNDANNKSCTITLRPIYYVIKYNITYDLNGGSGSFPNSYTVEDNVKLGTPIKTGYTFIGWSLGLSEDLVLDVEFHGIPGNRKYTAHWKPNEYNISFDVKGGKEIEGLTVLYGSYVKLPVPVKMGYEFLGWDIYNSTLNSLIYNYTHDLIIVAQWKTIDYDIIIEYNGGIGFNPEKYTVESNTFELNNPSKTGYKFKGWSIGNSDTIITSYTVSNGSIGNLEFSAHWEPIEYSIHYAVESDVTIEKITQKVVYDSDVTLLVPTKKGYTFSGWYMNNELFDVSKWNIDGDVTLEPQWEANTYNIYYNNQLLGSATYNDYYQISFVNKSDLNFEGFRINEKIITNNKGESLEKYLYDVDIHVQPFYSYTVSFETYGGDVIDEITLGTSERINEEDINTSKGDYTFGGWYYEDYLDNVVDFNSICKNTKVYAKWYCPEYYFKIGGNTIYGFADGYENVETRLIFPNQNYNNGEIYQYAFKGSNVELVIIPEGFISIGNEAFFNCESLKHITFADSVTYIGVQSFSNCNKLEDFAFPENLETINHSAFTNCTSLRYLTIPKSVDNVEFGSYIFYGCKDLTLYMYKSTTYTSKGNWNCYWMSANAYEYIKVIYLD